MIRTQAPKVESYFSNASCFNVLHLVSHFSDMAVSPGRGFWVLCRQHLSGNSGDVEEDLCRKLTLFLAFTNPC